MLPRHAVLLTVLHGVVTFACERTDHERKPASASTTPSAPAASSASPTAAVAPPSPQPTCVVSMPPEAPKEASPAAECPPDPDGPADLPRGSVRFVDAPGRPVVEVELARTDAHRTRGLMYRTELDRDAGMLFSWPTESYRSFWMRNTCLPLDMLFIARDGTIAGVLEQVPTLNEQPRGVRCPAAHVLEVNAGYVRAHGIEPGQRIEITP